MLMPVTVIFYFFATVAVVSALYVITTKNPVQSALSLVVTFFAMAGVWMLLQAEFLSLILLLVYVGAVMTLFLFVVMMLSVDREAFRTGYVKYWPFAVLILLVLVGILLVAVGPTSLGVNMTPVEQMDAPSNMVTLGSVLYTEYAYPFEIAGVILLAAIIAAITLTHRAPKRRRNQVIQEQVECNPADRVRLVDMPSASKAGDAI